MTKFFKKFSFFTWFILAVNVIFLIWIIVGINAGQSGSCDPAVNPQDCETAKDVGTTVGVALIVFFWAAVDVVLGVIWLITRRSRKHRDMERLLAEHGITKKNNNNKG